MGEGRAQDQRALLPDRGGQEEPGQADRAGRQAAAEDQDVQEADRGGGGDRRPQPGQVQEGSAGAGGDRGESQVGRGTDALLNFNIGITKDYRYWMDTERNIFCKMEQWNTLNTSLQLI